MGAMQQGGGSHGRWPGGASSSSEIFRRTGTVRAVRVCEPRSWTTESGSTLTVSAGGWWVTGPDGTGRGVDAAEFPKLYERHRADPQGMYRRRGTVRAVQVSEPGTIATLEGPADYRAGDWIVTNDGRNYWPVPDATFRASYEREPSGPDG
ncbi:MAG TPA: hypothetical protein VFC82_09940 [Actinomycetaceae bacterium]|nr:hypothetical protein [Actinomycetaceae bacterium]